MADKKRIVDKPIDGNFDLYTRQHSRYPCDLRSYAPPSEVRIIKPADKKEGK